MGSWMPGHPSQQLSFSVQLLEIIGGSVRWSLGLWIKYMSNCSSRVLFLIPKFLQYMSELASWLIYSHLGLICLEKKNQTGWRLAEIYSRLFKFLPTDPAIWMTEGMIKPTSRGPLPPRGRRPDIKRRDPERSTYRLGPFKLAFFFKWIPSSLFLFHLLSKLFTLSIAFPVKSPLTTRQDLSVYDPTSTSRKKKKIPPLFFYLLSRPLDLAMQRPSFLSTATPL